MKRGAVLIFALVLTAGLVWLLAQAGVASSPPLASLFPAGPSLYLEARDFHSLLSDWNASQEKTAWLASDNYQVFSRSNLFQKLEAARTEFAQAAGIPPGMALLENAAGAASAIAIYDIGKLHFLYISRMPAARVADSALWKTRGSYEPRKAANLDYFIKYDKASDRTAAFASAKDYLLLATREDLLAGALALLAGQAAAPITSEPWYATAVQSASTSGDLRLVLNMPHLLASPYMRSYWIQRNASDLKQYDSAISDLTRSSTGFTEARSLFRRDAETPSWNETAVAQILRMVPPGAGFYQAIASPALPQTLALIREKIVAPQAGTGPDSTSAPQAANPDSLAGTEADLEIRTDEPPLDTSAQPEFNELRNLIQSASLQAILQIGATRVLPDQVFVAIDSAVVLLRTGNWDENAVRDALMKSGASLGGPAAIGIAARGPVLILTSPAAFLQPVLENLNKPAATTPARYAAWYQHSRELANFEKLTKLIDNPLRQGDAPMFFSQNVASLGRVLTRLDFENILVHDDGKVVRQNLTYQWK